MLPRTTEFFDSNPLGKTGLVRAPLNPCSYGKLVSVATRSGRQKLNR